jgi:hypothetical protein
MSSYISNFDLSERLCHFLTLGAWKLGYCEAIQENEQYWSDKFKQIDMNLLLKLSKIDPTTLQWRVSSMNTSQH